MQKGYAQIAEQSMSELQYSLLYQLYSTFIFIQCFSANEIMYIIVIIHIKFSIFFPQKNGFKQLVLKVSQVFVSINNCIKSLEHCNDKSQYIIDYHVSFPKFQVSRDFVFFVTCTMYIVPAICTIFKYHKPMQLTEQPPAFFLCICALNYLMTISITVNHTVL